MKKSLLILLALLLISSMLLTACDLENSVTSTNTAQSANNSSNGGGGNGGSNNGGGGGNKTPEIPSQPSAGYSFKTVDDLRFEYPSNWEDLSNEESIYLQNPDAFSHIIVEIGEDASFWTELTPQDFESEEPPTNGVNIEAFVCRENQHSISVNIATCTLNATDAKTFVLATTINNVSYAINLNVNEKEFSLAETIFNSIVNLNPGTGTEPNVPIDPNPELPAPEGYVSLSRYNLSFFYPEAWLITQSTHRDIIITHNTSKILLYSGPITTVFSEITKEQFLSENVPNIEEEKGGKVDNVSVEHTTNANGLTVTLISYSITVQNETTWLFGAFVTIDQTSHALELSSTTKDEELFLTILNSMKAIDGPNYTPESENNSESNTSPSPDDPCTSDPSNPSNNEQVIYEEAERFYKNGDYEKAYALFSQIPNHPGVDAYLDELEELLNSNDSSSKNEK